MQGSTESKVWKKFGHFPVRKKIVSGLLAWKKKIIFQTCIFDMRLHSISLNIGYFTFIVLTILMPVF